MRTVEQFNQAGQGKLPGHLGIIITYVGDTEVRAELPVTESLMAPNGYLHAGSVVTLADTCAGYGCMANLPAGATGFTTIELKSNHLGTALSGVLAVVAIQMHMGRTTQVWDAVVRNKDTDKTIALFRCTQMILYGKPSRLDSPRRPRVVSPPRTAPVAQLDRVLPSEEVKQRRSGREIPVGSGVCREAQ